MDKGEKLVVILIFMFFMILALLIWKNLPQPPVVVPAGFVRVG